MGLYRKLLGSDFEKLGQVLQKFHTNPGEVVGHLTVTHSTATIPRFFIWLMRLPKEGHRLSTELSVTFNDGRETWTRQIGSAILKTSQRAKDGRLIESAGPLEFVFDLEASEGAMLFHHYRSKLLGISLPRRIAPIIEASASPCGSGWKVLVDIQCPRYGTICRYEGEIGPK